MDQVNRIPVEEWKEKKQAEREQVYEEQNTALKEVCASGASLFSYLTGHGRLGSAVSVGNAALVLKQFPNARAVMSMKGWNEYGRRISKGAKGIRVLAKSGKYMVVDRVFEVSQTHGDRPYQNYELDQDPKNLQTAILAMQQLSRVPLHSEQDEIATRYDAASDSIIVASGAVPSETMQQLSAALVGSYIAHQDERPSEDVSRLYSTAVALEVCGRFGVKPQDVSAQLDEGLSLIPSGRERQFLSEVREFALAIGNHIEHHLPQRNKAPVRSPHTRG